MAISYAKRVKPKHVRLAGIDLMPRGPVQFEMTNIHGRKVAVGDPGPDSHPTNSTITQHSWAGGGQIAHANEASDMQRFYWATLMTEYDHYLTLPFETHTYSPVVDSTFSMCLGDYPFGDNGEMFFQIGTKLYKYDAISDDLDLVVDMGTFSAVGAGVVYTIPIGADMGETKLLIPGGSEGTGVWDGVSFSTIPTALAVDLAVWDEKLFLLAPDGKLWWGNQPIVGAFPGSGATGWECVGILTDGSTPRHIVNFVNRADAETLYVVSNSGVFGLDFANARLVKTYFTYPRHPRQGYGVEHWRAELWTSVGMGAHRYDLSQVIPAGIDRDQGVPMPYRGYVSDIVGSYNDLFMYIRGSQTGGVSFAEEETLDVGGGDETLYADSRLIASNNLVMAWNGIGFHYRWAGTGLNPGNMYVSQANDLYNLWWCNDGGVLRQRLPVDYFNPADPPSAQYTFAEEGELWTPWYDWNWADQVKILKRLEFGCKYASETETIDVFYQLDIDDSEHPEVHIPGPTGPTLTRTGRFSFPVGFDPAHEFMPDESRRYIGAPHVRFRLHFKFKRGPDKTMRPGLDWWSAVGRRVLNPIRTWRFNIDLTRQDMGGYPAGTADKLVALATKPEAVQFDIWDESYMVEVVALAGPKDATGQEFSNFLTVHLLEANDLEVPLP